MANKGEYIESKEFDSGFLQATAVLFPKLLGEGMFQAGAMLIRDAIKEKPRAPHRLGALWRSQMVKKPVSAVNGIIVVAGFNIAYAAYQHEGMRRGGTHEVRQYSVSRTQMVPASSSDFGRKFLSKKMAANGPKYLKHAADYCRSRVKR